MVQQESIQPSGTDLIKCLGKDGPPHAPADSVQSYQPLEHGGNLCPDNPSDTVLELLAISRRNRKLKHRHRELCTASGETVLIKETNPRTYPQIVGDIELNIESNPKHVFSHAPADLVRKSSSLERTGYLSPDSQCPVVESHTICIRESKLKHTHRDPCTVRRRTYPKIVGDIGLRKTNPTQAATLSEKAHATLMSVHDDATAPNDQLVTDESTDPSEDTSFDTQELDPTIPSVDGGLLEVVKSHFRADNGKGQVSGIGRGLVCHSHILPGQEITMFIGQVIPNQDVLRMPKDRRSYVIEMSLPDSLPTMLDCYETSQGDHPASLASIANCPLRLYDRVLDESYGKEDANAAVQTIVRNGLISAILYAKRHINSGQEILWNYPEVGDENCEMENRELVAQRGGHDQTDSCLAISSPNNPFDVSYAILDTASSTHVCKSRIHAHDMVPCSEGAITGIQSGTRANTYDHSCTFIDKQLGPTPFMPSASANIVSVAAARDHGMSMSYDCNSDEFTLASTNGARYTFGRIAGVRAKSRFYVMDLSTLKPPSLTVATQCLLSNDALIPPSIDTVKRNRMKYTKRENRDADTARAFIASVGYPNERVALSMVRGMANCHIKTEDIRRCFDIHGTPVQRVQGTTTQKTSKPAVMELGVTTVQKEQAAEVDLMFVRGMPFIIVILTPLEFSFALPLPDKSAESITEALDKVLIQCEQKGFVVQWVRSDNEPALCTKQAASSLASKSVSMDKSAPGQHAPRVERRIGFVKAKYRTIVSTTPYAMTSKLMVQGVIAANRYCNMQKASSSTSDLSPREKFLGRQLDYIRDVGVPFGTYCQATVPNTDNSDKPRTEACIALHPRES